MMIKRQKLKTITALVPIKPFITKVRINMISNIKIPGLPLTSKESFLANGEAEFGQIGNSWPSENNIFRGKLIRKLRRPHPTTGIIQVTAVMVDTLEEFSEREAEVYVLPAKTEFTQTIDEP